MAISWKKTNLPTLAEKKLAAVNEACREAIYAGIDVELSGGTEHFSLDIHEQTNIESMFTAVTLGAKEQQYSSDGGASKTYSAADIVLLYAAYKSFVTRHTAYCNLLKAWIKRETDTAVIAGITYGAELPADLKTQLQSAVDAAAAQLQRITELVSAGAFADKITSLEAQMTDTQIALCDVYELALGGEL